MNGDPAELFRSMQAAHTPEEWNYILRTVAGYRDGKLKMGTFHMTPRGETRVLEYGDEVEHTTNVLCLCLKLHHSQASPWHNEMVALIEQAIAKATASS